MTPGENLSRSDQKRCDIISAAIEEFQQLGYALTSIDRIADRAKVSKRTVYNHFKCKEDLFLDILNCLMATACAANPIVYQESESLESQLQSFIKTQIQLFGKPETLKLARLVMVELIRSPTLSQNAFKNFRNSETGLMNWFQQAKN